VAPVCILVLYLRHLSHQVEVRPVLVSETCHVTQLRQQHDLLACLTVLRHDQWLMRVLYGDAVFFLKVIGKGDRLRVRIPPHFEG